MISGSILFLLVIVLIIINLIIWGLEYALATLRWLYNWIKNRRPDTEDWKIYYLSIRIIFTRLLNKVLFAVASRKEIRKYHIIENKHQNKMKWKLSRDINDYLKHHKN